MLVSFLSPQLPQLARLKQLPSSACSSKQHLPAPVLSSHQIQQDKVSWFLSAAPLGVAHPSVALMPLIQAICTRSQPSLFAQQAACPCPEPAAPLWEIPSGPSDFFPSAELHRGVAWNSQSQVDLWSRKCRAVHGGPKPAKVGNSLCGNKIL